MRFLSKHHPSPAMVVACIALLFAMTGAGYAAIKLPKNSVGAKQLKANAVSSPKVKDDAITGADVNEASLGTVPSATNAVNATNATNATNAVHAASANSAGTANAAYSTYDDSFVPFPDTPGPIATLNIPAAGSYVISVKFAAFNASSSPSLSDTCTLTAGSDVDTTYFDVDGASVDDQEVVVLQVSHQFGAAGQAVLSCDDGGAGLVFAVFTRITAIQVAQVTNTTFSAPGSPDHLSQSKK